MKRDFDSLNSRKACGPDGVKTSVLKMCSAQLSDIYTFIFNLSLKCHVIPYSWKCSEIIPVPKKTKIKEMNDLRPVALTSVPMKCLERLVLYELRKVFDRFQDPLQFAYGSKRSVDDAILIFLDNV